jgi:hypothetical protein
VGRHGLLRRWVGVWDARRARSRGRRWR